MGIELPDALAGEPSSSSRLSEVCKPPSDAARRRGTERRVRKRRRWRRFADGAIRVGKDRGRQYAATSRTSRTRRGIGGACALTFDDGPDPVWTPRVLACLGDGGARATFFVMAARAAAHPALVDRMRAEGHEIALHCVRHVRHTEIDEPALRRDTRRGCASSSASACGRGTGERRGASPPRPAGRSRPISASSSCAGTSTPTIGAAIRPRRCTRASPARSAPTRWC